MNFKIINHKQTRCPDWASSWRGRPTSIPWVVIHIHMKVLRTSSFFKCKIRLDVMDFVRVWHSALQGPVTPSITHELLGHHAQIRFVRREIDQIFGVSGTEITDESRMNHAWTAQVSFTITDIIIVHVDANERIRCSILRTFNARITDGARPNTHDSRTSVEWTWYVRCSRWASMDVRGFEQVPTHKHWRPTHVPR